MDIVANDEYPNPTAAQAPILAALDCDLMRSIKDGAPWIVTSRAREPRPGVNYKKLAGMVRLWSLQMVAHGADAIMFFQWRQSRFGQEKFESGMVSHAGTHTQRWPEIRDFEADLKKLAEVAGGRTVAQVAVMHDQNSAWAFDQPAHPNGLLRCREILIDHYRPLRARNVSIDFVQPNSDLTRHRLVVIPNLHLVGEDAARRIAEYVAAGGTILMGPFSGIVDSTNQAYLGGYPAPFRELLGLRIEDFYAQGPDGFAVIFEPLERQVARDWADWIELEGAETIASFEGPLQGRPAISRHQYGTGTARYVGTFLDDAGMDFLVGRVIAEVGVRPVADVPAGIEVTNRERDGISYLFVLNHTTDEMDVPLAMSTVPISFPGSSLPAPFTWGPRCRRGAVGQGVTGQ